MSMYTVTINQTVRRKESQQLREGGVSAPVLFFAERKMSLPFLPFPGLVIEISSIEPDHDPFEPQIERVIWIEKEGRFHCECKDVEYIHSGQLVSESRQWMTEDADEYARNGWTVDGRWLLQGQWKFGPDERVA